VLQIEEKPQAYIEDIVFKGNTKTQEFVLRRLVTLAPGDVFSKTKVLESLRNLYNTQYFSSIVPEYEQGSQELFVDLIVSVEEQSTASIQFGLTYTPSATFPIIGLVNWSDINFLGRGQTLALKTNLAIDSQDLTFSFSDEWLFGKRLSGAVDFSFAHASLQASQDSSGVLFDANDPSRVPDPYNSYEEYLAAGRVIPAASLMDYDTWTLSLGYSSGYRFSSPIGTIGFVPGIVHELNRTTYDDTLHTPFDSSISENLNTWLFSNSVYGRAYINDLDLWYDPSKGYYVSQRLSLTGWFTGEVGDHFIRSDTRADAFATLFNFPLVETWSLKAVLGAHSKFSTLLAQPGRELEVSSPKMLFIDGTFVGRGWSKLATQTGTSLWDNWLELRIPAVPGVLSLDGFLSAALVGAPVGSSGFLDINDYESGTISYDTSLSPENFAYSAGFGLRFIILQFPFRIYFAKQFVFDASSGFKSSDNTDWQFVLSVTTNLD
jgi:outer membrane protein insertion porin family